MTDYIKYEKYTTMMNRIAYWLIKNNKKVAEATSYKGIKLSQAKDKILKGKGKSNLGIEYTEYAISHMKNYKDFPSYVIEPKYTKTIYIDMCKRVINYRKKHNSNPKIVYLNKSHTTSKKGKYGHATETGCDNRGQNNGYYCGCHSLQEVFRNLTGKVIPQSTIAKIAGTTTAGTDHNGLNTAVAWFNKKYGYNLTVKWKNFSDLGWKGIKKIIDSNNQDCIIHNLYRNKYGHYEVINKINDYVYVQNSLGNTCNRGCYCGYTETRSKSEFKSYINGISQKSVMVITRK